MTTGLLDSTLTAIGMGGLVPAKPAEAPAEAPAPPVAETPPQAEIPPASEKPAPITEFAGFTIPTKEQITETAGKFVDEAKEVVNTATETVAATTEPTQEFIASSVATGGDPSVEVPVATAKKEDNRNLFQKAGDGITTFFGGEAAEAAIVAEPTKYDIAKPYIESTDFTVVEEKPSQTPDAPTLEDSNNLKLKDGKGRDWTASTYFKKDKENGKDFKVTIFERVDQDLLLTGDLSSYEYVKEIDLTNRNHPPSADLLYMESRTHIPDPPEYTIISKK